MNTITVINRLPALGDGRPWSTTCSSLASPALQHSTADRAGARRTFEIPSASHGATLPQPRGVAELILHASGLPTTAGPKEKRS
jgi:hypothetical protein